jgi:hypothetical protein
MNYYQTLETLRLHFSGDPIVNQISQGDIFGVDLDKKTIFPLVHIMVNNTITEEFVVRYNITIMAMDIVDITKENDTNLFYGMDNETDALNAMHDVLIRAYKLMKSGYIWDQKVQVEDNATLEPFAERFENNLAGWAMTFDVTVPNTMSVCDTDGYIPFCQPATVTNSNQSYTATVASGAVLTLPNETLNIQIDGILAATSTYPPLSNQTINLVWQ